MKTQPGTGQGCDGLSVSVIVTSPQLQPTVNNDVEWLFGAGLLVLQGAYKSKKSRRSGRFFYLFISTPLDTVIDNLTSGSILSVEKHNSTKMSNILTIHRFSHVVYNLLN